MPILSFPHHFLSPQVTEELQRTFRRVWPRFQPKFCPQYGDRPREEGQECRKDPHPHPERRQGQGPWCRPQRRRDRHPRWELFPSQPRPTRRRTCKSVRFRTGSVPSPLFFHVIFLPHHHRHPTFSKRWARSRAVLGIINAVPRAPQSRVAGLPLFGSRAFAPNPQPWTPLLTMSITGYRQREQEYGCPLIFPPRCPWPR